ncbi:MAG: hypothetical protein VX236_01225 [Pseudomonadota bacterium]|nr:hypothetical protein [Pseudomonadota bacterium]
MRKRLRIMLCYGLVPLVAMAIVSLVWLIIDSSLPLEDYFKVRHADLENVRGDAIIDGNGQLSRLATATSTSGLSVLFRLIRPAEPTTQLPVIIILGGHRTGSDAVELFGNVGDRAVVAIDYPYEGAEKVHGWRRIIATVPLARKAFRDTPPAVSLILDWLEQQPWADQDQLVLVGASLGVPFAALVAARDPRIDVTMLVHGAADNRAWLEIQVARRNEVRLLHGPAAPLLHWLAYGPTFNTAANVARIAPRPVIVIGAREDERTPAGETEALFRAAGEPKILRWTEGMHIQPNRPEIIRQLLTIAEEELPLSATDR